MFSRKIVSLRINIIEYLLIVFDYVLAVFFIENNTLHLPKKIYNYF